MNRIKMTVAYDGTAFCGYQSQPKGRTIQEEIEKSLKKFHKGKEVRIHSSGRTDTGVHARGQVFHFDTFLDIPPRGWENGLNTMLPSDIRIIEVEQVSSDFHARYSSKKKEYRYFFYTNKQKDIFKRNFAYHFPFTIDERKINEAASKLCGTHDFTSFCSAKTGVDDKVRTLYTIDLQRHDDGYVFRFVGNGFLYNMVRILVATLLEVGVGRIEPEQMEEILALKNRNKTRKTAPGHGLYLWKVYYESHDEISLE